MVAVTQAKAWLLGAFGILVIGTVVRLALGGFSVQALSAALLGAILWLALWVATLVLGNPRLALLVGLPAMLVLDLAGLQPRASVEYDAREVLYRTDQTVTATIPSSASNVQILVSSFSVGASPRFGLAADLGSVHLAWACPFRVGMQRLDLPLPAGAAGELLLRLTGAPSREGDYLIVYTSSANGGRAVVRVGQAPTDATRCALA